MKYQSAFACTGESGLPLLRIVATRNFLCTSTPQQTVDYFSHKRPSLLIWKREAVTEPPHIKLRKFKQFLVCGLDRLTYLCLKVALTLIEILPLQLKSCVQLTSPCFVVYLPQVQYTRKREILRHPVFIPICAGAAPAWRLR